MGRHMRRTLALFVGSYIGSVFGTQVYPELARGHNEASTQQYDQAVAAKERDVTWVSADEFRAWLTRNGQTNPDPANLFPADWDQARRASHHFVVDTRDAYVQDRGTRNVLTDVNHGTPSYYDPAYREGPLTPKAQLPRREYTMVPAIAEEGIVPVRFYDYTGSLPDGSGGVVGGTISLVVRQDCDSHGPMTHPDGTPVFGLEVHNYPEPQPPMLWPVPPTPPSS